MERPNGEASTQVILQPQSPLASPQSRGVKKIKREEGVMMNEPVIQRCLEESQVVCSAKLSHARARLPEEKKGQVWYLFRLYEQRQDPGLSPVQVESTLHTEYLTLHTKH